MPAILPIPRPWISTADIRKKRYKQNEKNQEFYECVKDIISHPAVRQMKKFYQHCETDCYEHCLNVAYNNFCICKYLGLDARSAARGGMLHDLFLYDWRQHRRKTGDRLHAITHPIAAYRNARKYFKLNKVEKEVITKHMWPVSLIPPRYPETYVICLTDKYCGSMEIADHYSNVLQKKIWGRPAAWLMKRVFAKVPRAEILQELVPELDSMERAARPESFAQLRCRPSSGWGHASGRRRRFS
ncbi:MAG: HD domain-containing protein [Clostridiales bacterium]|nr:HD domain-containing protein [Clostridiales bacterium]